MAKTPKSVKAKGSRFERKCSKIFEDTLSHHSIHAKRTPMSGAIADWKNDITLNLPLAVECKNVERLDFRAAFRQAEAARRPSQIPLLLTSRNYEEQILAVMDFKDLLTLMDYALEGGWNND